MKISNETKVGILTIVALVILILGFNFLKGKDVLKKRKKIYAVFGDLGPLSKSNEVKINGYVIGSVYDLEAKDKNISGIVATINLTEEVNIPRDSKAYISSPLVGASFIAIERGTDPEFLKPGDTLLTRIDAGILDDVKAQLNPTLTKVRSVLDTLARTLSGVNGLINSEAKTNLQQTLANLNRASSALNGLMDNQTGPLAATLNNAKDITANLLKNNDSINLIIANAKVFTDKMARIAIQPTIDSLNNAIGMMRSTIARINSKDGTLGALINDRALYNKLTDAIMSVEILMDDLRAHPKRYVNLSIFGRKDRGDYLTSPLPKDSVPPEKK
jgi:phospholipid/cholesterol/gamma-HCH transport system substrate-binding protein